MLGQEVTFYYISHVRIHLAFNSFHKHMPFLSVLHILYLGELFFRNFDNACVKDMLKSFVLFMLILVI